jgi:hypothetical protein
VATFPIGKQVMTIGVPQGTINLFKLGSIDVYGEPMFSLALITMHKGVHLFRNYNDPCLI